MTNSLCEKMGTTMGIWYNNKMKRIIWDWNGTLLDDVHLCFDCINRLLISQQMPPLKTLDEYRSVFGFPIKNYYQKLGFDFEKTSYASLAKCYMDDYQNKSYACSLTQSAKSTLKHAKELGYEQTILSASQKEYLDAQIAQYHIDGYINEVLGISNIYAHSKLDLAKEFVSSCSTEDEIWFIGDSIHDFEVAQSVKAHCILVTSGHQSKKRLESCGVPVLETTEECLEYIHARDRDYQE